MAAKGYCEATDVAAQLGLSFTGAQHVQCASLIERAEAYLDSQTNRSWLVGEQTQEAHFSPAELLLLEFFPVSSVTAVYGRSALGEDETTLTADVDYEVRDLDAGIIRLVTPGDYDRIRVTYTPSSAVPADVKMATVELVAAWMQPSLRPGTWGVDSYQLPDLSVKFSRSHYQMDPPMVREVIGRYYVPEVG